MMHKWDDERRTKIIKEIHLLLHHVILLRVYPNKTKLKLKSHMSSRCILKEISPRKIVDLLI